MGIKVLAPVLVLYVTWPVLGLPALVAVFPFLFGCAVQFVFEIFIDKRGAACWPLVPIIFEVYRLYQLTKATHFIERLLFPVRQAFRPMMSPEVLDRNGALVGLVVTFQVVGIFCLWSLITFLMRLFPSRPVAEARRENTQTLKHTHTPLDLHKHDKLAMAMAFKMATTGMCVTDECTRSFMEMKWKKAYRYIVFKIDEKSRDVIVDKVGAACESYADLTASLPVDDCRYAVFDFDFVSVDNCRKSKMFFIAWAPAASRVRAKLLYATSKAGLRRALEGVHYELQATDPTEMGFDVIMDRAN